MDHRYDTPPKRHDASTPHFNIEKKTKMYGRGSSDKGYVRQLFEEAKKKKKYVNK